MIEVVIGVIIIVLAISVFKVAQEKYYQKLYPMEYKELVQKYSKEYNVPEMLIFSVIKNESSFNKDAISSIGARGLMQMTEEAFEWTLYREGEGATYTFDDLFTPEISIKYGTYMLSLLLDEFEDEKTALAAYHAGRGKVNEWLANEEYSKDAKTLDTIPYKDTNWYVENTLKTKETYQKIYED